MTTSQRELLILLAHIIGSDVAAPAGVMQKRIMELLAEINAGSQELR